MEVSEPRFDQIAAWVCVFQRVLLEKNLATEAELLKFHKEALLEMRSACHGVEHQIRKEKNEMVAKFIAAAKLNDSKVNPN